MTITSFPPIGGRWNLLRSVSCAVILLSVLAAPGRAAGTCDLSSDGLVNVVDVQIGLNQSLGAQACSTADVNGDGQCNVVDVQLLINTALGSPCPAQATVSPSPSGSGPWVTNFTPQRTHYVSPNGTGSGTIGSPESFGAAASHYACGDLHIYRGGTYTAGSSNEVNLSRDCTSSKPAVFKGYVDANGQQENVNWRFEINQPGRWNWFVNLHCDQTGAQVSGTGCVEFRKAGNRWINSVGHDPQSVVLSSFRNPGSSEPGMVAYGNILYRAGPGVNGAHNVYTTNDFDSGGYKYFVQNLFFEPVDNQGRRIFQANDSNGDRGLSGYWLEKNFFGDAAQDDGNTIVWTQGIDGAGNKEVVFKDNVLADFYHSASLTASVRMGTGAAVQFRMTGNYFARANIAPEGYWGNAGAHPATIFTGNEIYDPPGGIHIHGFQTQGTSGAIGSHKIPDADVWNNNTYGGTFKADLYCGGSNYGSRTLAQWRSGTSGCRATPGGSGFDLNSSTVPNPTSNKVVVLLNEYQCSSCVFRDQQRGNIYVINWTGASSQTVNISPVVGPSKQYVVRYPRDFFGTPAASGVCPATGACNVSLPTKRHHSGGAGRFANAYVITAQP